jgi:hypothetical protein
MLSRQTSLKNGWNKKIATEKYKFCERLEICRNFNGTSAYRRGVGFSHGL